MIPVLAVSSYHTIADNIVVRTLAGRKKSGESQAAAVGATARLLVADCFFFFGVQNKKNGKKTVVKANK